ncbi:hypothetical protein PVK06_018018 [Gossypium arboreum]|uniref:Pectinesterase inhibitor domain-containing protein n=1 Tax=Gossypium arboreum TaxID=29729 RepID=A0ABR0Q480_GOSAR|nr:hypothetical protein PVK06_018018 [Gossypium arboreum]
MVTTSIAAKEVECSSREKVAEMVAMKPMMEAGKQQKQKILPNKMMDEVKVSAALTDEDTCMDGFSSSAMNGYAKMMVRKRIIKITHLMSNVLALVNNYASSQILH